MDRLSRRAFSLGAAGLGTTLAFPFIRQSVGATPRAIEEIVPPPVNDPSYYDVYIPTACKAGDFYYYSCEFDASWAVMKTYGIDAPFEEQLAAIKIDRRIEPYAQETANGVMIYGGDITTAYSGDYTSSFLARTTGAAMRAVFKHYGLRVTHVHTRERIEQNLQRGRLIWIKTTVDFKDWTPATWVTPEGKELDVVYTNDHAAIVIGYNQDVVVIRDILGPTDTNWQRPHEYEVTWDRFLECWGAQGSDGLAVGPYGDDDE
jgi:uncharacterized protein YvpB